MFTTHPAFYDKFSKHRSNLSQIPHFSLQNQCFLLFFCSLSLGQRAKVCLPDGCSPPWVAGGEYHFVAQMLVHFVDYI
jgi:hypothetical protein